MQSIAPLSPSDFLSPVQRLRYKVEVYDGSTWHNLCAFGNPAKNLVRSFSFTPSGAGRDVNVIAGRWSAEILDTDGLFNPLNDSSSYKDLLQAGRKIRISVGINVSGTDYFWPRFVGLIDEPQFDASTKTIRLSGCDYADRLADFKLIFPDNYWGNLAIFDSVASFTETGNQLYDLGDCFDRVNETNAIDSSWQWVTGCEVVSVSETGGGSQYACRFRLVSVSEGWLKNEYLGFVTKDSRYILRFKYYLAYGAPMRYEVAQVVNGQRTVLATRWLDAGGWKEEIVSIIAQATGSIELYFYMNWQGAYSFIDEIGLRLCEIFWYRYQMPEDCNGPFRVRLDGEEIYQGTRDKNGKFNGWLYDPDTRYFYFDEERTVQAGIDNLLIDYYTDQIPENVVADILVKAGYYPSRSEALADMNYLSTGIVISRIWFKDGETGIEAIRKICERLNYRFWFDYNGKPCFLPTPVAKEIPDFDFESLAVLSGHALEMDVGDIRNSISLIGSEVMPYLQTAEQKNSKLTASARDESSIQIYGERSYSSENQLFQDKESLENMAATVLAEWKDPRYICQLSVPFNAVPIEIGDTIAWRYKVGEITLSMTGVVRAVSFSPGSLEIVAELVSNQGGELHELLSSTHYDTEIASPEAGALIVGDGDPEIPLSEPTGSQHALLSETHSDTEPAAPELGGVIVASGDGPVLWRKLSPPGEAGRLLVSGSPVPSWGPKIYVSDSPPTAQDGQDGDIWLEY